MEVGLSAEEDAPRPQRNERPKHR